MQCEEGIATRLSGTATMAPNPRRSWADKSYHPGTQRSDTMHLPMILLQLGWRRGTLRRALSEESSSTNVEDAHLSTFREQQFEAKTSM